MRVAGGGGGALGRGACFFLVVRFALALWCSCAGAGYGVMGLRAAVRGAALRSGLSVLRRESCKTRDRRLSLPLPNEPYRRKIACMRASYSEALASSERYRTEARGKLR